MSEVILGFELVDKTREQSSKQPNKRKIMLTMMGNPVSTGCNADSQTNKICYGKQNDKVQCGEDWNN